ncbi:chemotaxis protein CheD [Gymnodinialimonas sp. 2305UL16-5]|uniref:chemotaxis protein CheD n=1 Tax=Gymnodinialimonas mytili TaxID=3126503 RepID=UPI0030B1E13C
MILVTDPRTLHVMQGQLKLSETPDDVLVALLGSCVAACMRDPILKIGGMNHFLLPGDDPSANSNSARYGARSMEELVNALLRKGASRRNLEVWLYGGADVLRNSTKIGSANAKFATEFVKTEGFRLRGGDLGGKCGRRMRFHPHSGAVEHSYIETAPDIRPISTPPDASSGQVELF